jgi:hypothetical protein
MDFMEPIAIVVAGILAAAMANRLVLITPRRYPVIDVVLVGEKRLPGVTVARITGSMVGC